MVESKPKTIKKILQKKKKAIKNFKNPDLLTLIKEEFDKDHIGDNLGKMFLFLCELSSRLSKQYRFSSALIGDSSEGKTSMCNTTSRYLSQDWYLDVGRITQAGIEKKVNQFDIIFFREVNKNGMNASIIDTIKALVEDGIRIIKYDTEKNNKELIDIKSGRKVGIYTTTGSQDDDELENRYCIIAVTGCPQKYKEVNDRTKNVASDPKLEIEMLKRHSDTNWITEGLKLLKDFDIITIPCAKFIVEKTTSARAMRDLKRFLNLIRVIAWLHQFERYTEVIDGKKVLYASPEDIYNAYKIGSDILSQSYTQLDSRTTDTLQAIAKLTKVHGIAYPELLPEIKEFVTGKLWVSRTELQKEMNISSVNTIKKRLSKPIELGLIDVAYTRNKTRCFISMVNQDMRTVNDLSKNRQLPVRVDFLKTSGSGLYRQVNDRCLTYKLIGNRQVKEINKSNIISYK